MYIAVLCFPYDIVPFHEMPAAKTVVMLLRELRTIFAVQLAWMYMLVVISNEVIFGGSAKAHFSLIVQE